MAAPALNWRSVAGLVLAGATLGLAGVPYSEYILAPSSRTVYASSIYKVNGSVTGAQALTQPHGNTVLHGGSAVTLDFEVEIGGLVSIAVGSGTSPHAAIGLTYTESSQWISSDRCDSSYPNAIDDMIYLPVGGGPGTYTVDRKHTRGGFKYLSLISNSSETIHIESVSVAIKSAPAQEDLRAYTGYFHCNDELLNRLWYAGAYTCQVATIDPTVGNSWVGKANPTPEPAGQLPLNEWYLNQTVSNGTSLLTDGGKRDRIAFGGDMEISLNSVAVSTGDLYSVRNAIDNLLSLQQSDGRMPYAGTPLPISFVSWTYHLHDLVAIYNYYIYSGDQAFLEQTWEPFKNAIQWSLSSIDVTGLMYVGSPFDWLRLGMGGHNIEANAILYFTLNRGLELAAAMKDDSVVQDWTNTAAKLKSAANLLLWDPTAGLYKDNETTTLHPQDGNTWAIKANLTQSSQQAVTISNALHARWGPYGAPAPEAGPTVSPYIGGIELEAHYLANAPELALDLMRLEWGFMLNDPRMTNSTFIEGYATDGQLTYINLDSDQTISHAHGWSTGPTMMLSLYTGGIQLQSAGGKTWHIAPQLGDLSSVSAGYSTSLGSFSTWVEAENGKVCALQLSTPQGTSGSVSLPGTRGTLKSWNGKTVRLDQSGNAHGLQGGTWTLHLD